MSAIKLTKENVGTLPAVGQDTLYPDSDPRNGVSRLYLRVRAGGSRNYIIQWRKDGIQRRMTIGKAGLLSLDEARRKARKELVAIDDGVDPVAEKAKARVDDKLLFGTVAKDYLELRAKDMRRLSLVACKRHLEKYFKALHKYPLARIDRAMVATELRSIAKDSGPVAADRGRSSLSAFFGWAMGEGIVEANPVIGTNKHNKAPSRDRVLSDDELVAVWNAAPSSDFGRIVKLLMLTGQRRTEISALRWSELSDDAISLPKERTKNNRAHEVPLSPQARAVLDEAVEVDGRDIVFGGGQAGFSNFTGAKDTLDEASGVVGWTLHDLRRTTATRMADLGVLPHIIEAVLNHVSGHRGGIAGVYNRSSYAPEKRAALELWGNHISILLAKADGGNITRLRA